MQGLELIYQEALSAPHRRELILWTQRRWRDWGGRIEDLTESESPAASFVTAGRELASWMPSEANTRSSRAAAILQRMRAS